jgi:two-component system, cell cycle response regulator
MDSSERYERRAARIRRPLGFSLFGATALIAVSDAVGVNGEGLAFAVGGPIYDLVVISAGVACLARAYYSPSERGAWILIGAGILAWAAGEIYWTWFYYNDASPPSPSLSDIGYLALYPLFLAGLWLLVHARIREIDPGLRMDSLVAALGTAALGTTFIFDFVADRASGTEAEVIVNLTYPLLDIVLLSAVVGVFALSNWRPGKTWTMLLVGLTLTAFADIGFSLQSASASATSGDWTEPVYLLSAATLGVAAWQSEVRPSRSFFLLEGWRELMVPAIFGAIVVGLLVMHYLSPASGLSVLLAAATVIAILARLAASVRQNQTLLEHAQTDALTSLGSRSRLQTDLARECRGATSAEPVALLLFDLDGFKLYNDTFGHPAGDALLRRLGRALQEAVNPYGWAYRIGGDEFCVLLHCEPQEFERATAAAAAALREDGGGFEVSSSWGSVLIPEEAAHPSAALQMADVRLYERKDSGRISAGSQVEEALLAALEERQPELGRHVHSVAGLAMKVGQRLGLEPGALTLLHRAAQLHDVGKMAIPDAILQKPGPLDTEDRRFIERHTIFGERIIAAAPSLAPVAPIVRSSHERFDGTGYPDELAGDEIPLASRIIFACDAFYAITAERPYSPARTAAEAIEELRFCAGGQFDPAVVEAVCAELTAPVADAPEASRTPRRPGPVGARQALGGVTALGS